MILIRRPVPFPEMLTFRDSMDRWFDDRFFRPVWPFDPERDHYRGRRTPESVVTGTGSLDEVYGRLRDALELS